MSAIRFMLIALAAHLSVPQDEPQIVHYLQSRDVLLTLAASDISNVTDVKLWVSSDDGQTWHTASAQRTGSAAVRYAAPADGHYAFYLVLKNEAGASGEPPQNGSKPQVRVVIDTAPPTLQLHGPVAGETASGPIIVIRSTLVDENLGPMAVRVFYRASEDSIWIDGGHATNSDNQLVWHIPPECIRPIHLRVVATDLAGNRASEELHGIDVAPPGKSRTLGNLNDTPTGRPSPAAGALTRGSDQLVAAVEVEPVPKAPAEERATIDTAEPQLYAPAVAALRQTGLRFMQERRYPLAVARLEEAAKLAPADADLAVDLGSALYHSDRYDEASARFAAALQAAPDHAGAIEGLALVAATQRRYPQAREHLLHLLRLAPDSPLIWLRYGDIEHQLGDAEKAVDAWKRVLELKDADRSLRDKATKRLKYFGPARRRAEP